MLNPNDGSSGAVVAITFSYTAPPAPVIASFSPPSATAEGSAFTLTVNGSGFISGATVDWNGSPLTTNFYKREPVDGLGGREPDCDAWHGEDYGGQPRRSHLNSLPFIISPAGVNLLPVGSLAQVAAGGTRVDHDLYLDQSRHSGGASHVEFLR